MFEKIVSDIISNNLGRFIQNLDQHQLSISIWKGQISLENLYLKEIPAFSDEKQEEEEEGMMTIRGGIIGKLVLDIPWSRLASEPVIANVENVLVVLTSSKYYRNHGGLAADRPSNRSAELEEKEIMAKEKKIERATKTKQLEAYEKKRLLRGLPPFIFKSIIISTHKNYNPCLLDRLID